MPILDGNHLTLDDIVATSRRTEPVQVAPTARDRVAASRRFADEVAGRRWVYGRSTGVGANRDQIVAEPGLAGPGAAALARHQLRGAPFGRAGPGDAGHPAQPARRRRQRPGPRGARRAGGDDRRRRPTAGARRRQRRDRRPRRVGHDGTRSLRRARQRASVRRTAQFGAGDALTFMSSNAAVLADAALAVADIDQLARSSMVVAAMAFAAVAATPRRSARPWRWPRRSRARSR